MADVFSKQKRSAVMGKIRSSNTKPEDIVALALRISGFMPVRNYKPLPGTPDLVLAHIGVIVEVRGCFWHGHYCLKDRIPRTNRKYWREKLAGNKKRRRRNEERLRAMGWSVRTIWECKLRSSSPEDVLSHVIRKIDQQPIKQASQRSIHQLGDLLAQIRRRRQRASSHALTERRPVQS